MLTITDPARVHDVLTDPRHSVPAAPQARRGGVGWLRANVARFATPRRHRSLRALAEAELAAVTPEALRTAARDWRGGRAGPSVPLLARALGRTVDAHDVALVARHYQPHNGLAPREADDAVLRLVAACRGEDGDDERTAARIGLLVQACEPTNALAERAALRRGSAPIAVAEVLAADPPVRLTRRVTPTGELVALDLSAAGLPFGAGAHACPGRARPGHRCGLS